MSDISGGLGSLRATIGLDSRGLGTSASKAKAELASIGGQTRVLSSDLSGTGRTGEKALSALSNWAGKFGVNLGPLPGLAKGISSSVDKTGQSLAAAAGPKGAGGLSAGLSAASTGAVVLGGALIGAAAAGIGKFQTATAEVRKLKGATGESAEEASKLRNVAKGLGVETDTLAKGMVKLVGNIQASKGELGGVRVELATTAKGTVDYGKTLDNLRTAYQSLSDPAAKNQFILDAFKKTGIELRPILSATNEEFERMKKAGPIFDDKDLERGRQLTLAQRALGQSFEELEVDLARGLVPVLTAVERGFTSLVSAGEKLHIPVVQIGLVAIGAGLGVNALAGAVAFAQPIIATATGNLTRYAAAEAAAGNEAALMGAKTAAASPKLAVMAGGLTFATAAAVTFAAKWASARVGLQDLLSDKAPGWLKTAVNVTFFGPLVEGFDRLFGGQKKSAGSAEELAAAEQELAAQLAETEARTRAQTAALDSLASAQRTSIDQSLGLTGAHHQAAEAALAVEKAQNAYDEVLKEHSAESIEAREAQLALEGAHQSQVEALKRLAESMAGAEVAQMKANGATLTGRQEAETYRAKLLEVAGTVGGELRQKLSDMANQISAMPDANVRVVVDTSQAETAVANIQAAIDSLHGNTASLGFSAPSLEGYAEGGVVRRAPTSRGRIIRAAEKGDELILPMYDPRRAAQLLATYLPNWGGPEGASSPPTTTPVPRSAQISVSVAPTAGETARAVAREVDWTLSTRW